MLRQQDVGHRIVVRRIVGVRDGRPQFTDALGELTELTESHLTVLTGSGPLRVPLTEVHRAKRVPPARRPAAGAVTAIELAAHEAWPAPVQERLGGWLLRAADGWTGRANSALPVGDPDRPLEEAIEAVGRWYAARGQPAMINVPLPLAAPVGTALDALGWSARTPVLVQTARLAGTPDLTANSTPADHRFDVRMTSTPSPDWTTLATGRLTGRRDQRPDAGPPPALRHLLTAVPRVCFAHVHPAGTADDPHAPLLAAGRGTVTGDGRWLGLTLLTVSPSARRQGLGRLLVRSLARWGAGLGATDVFLQVEEENAAAVNLYRQFGFRTHHTYVSRRRPETDTPG